MKNKPTSWLAVVVLLLFAVGIILYFVFMFSDRSSGSYLSIGKIFCVIMVVVSILAALVKSSGNSTDDSQSD